MIDVRDRLCAQNWIEQFRSNLGRSSAFRSTTGQTFHSIEAVCSPPTTFMWTLGRAFLWESTPQGHECWNNRQVSDEPLSR